ncbi:MAG TPA: winged helix-turn-helix domain-containing protein [Stellaceae bacterium]|nr:winged helix-turn-helix domain-containing protein [Stellaceae bacterium]
MVLAFGDYRLDIACRELRRGDELIGIAPKVFDLLAYLVEQRHRVVSKDDLLRAVWAGRIVSESALTTRINAARRAIGDDGTGQRLIRTFRRKGIRFIGEVIELPGAPARILGSMALLDKPSIAVLPFRHLSADPDQEYFVDGIVEEITTAIARFTWLLVMARPSRLTTKDTRINLKQTARETGARYLLEGSVRKTGNRVRIGGRLIDTETGAHIWSERFDGTLEDVFDLQDRIASAVAGAIEPRLRRAEIARANSKSTENLDAYDLYLRAQAQANLRTEASMIESVRLARCALELDPLYAPAMARLALSQMMRRSRHWVADLGPDVEEGIGMARQAIAVGGDDPWVLDLAGLALATLAGDYENAIAALDRALVLNPNFALGFGHRALVLAYFNRPEAAIRSAEQAIRLSPFDPAMFAFCEALALAHLTLRRYSEGLGWAEAAIRENSGLPGLRYKLSLCGHLDRFEEARQCCCRIREARAEPTVTALVRDMPRGVAAEVASHFIEGLRKAQVPEG